MFPGLYSTDSVWMVWQATDVVPLMNWHPTLLIRAWGLVIGATGSVASVWLAQTALAAVCAYALLRSATRRPAFVVAAALLLFPPLLAALAMTWKDTQLALVWWLVALVMLRKDLSRRWAAFLLVGVLAIGVARYNSIGLAVGPAWMACERLVGRGRPDRRRLWVATAAVAVVVGAVLIPVIGGSIGLERELHPEESSYTWDIVGIGLRTGDFLLPADAQADPPCTYEQFRDSYLIISSDMLWITPDACVDVGLVENDDGIQHVFFRDWLDAVVRHPVAYIQHRTSVALATLGITAEPPGTILHARFDLPESFLSPGLVARPMGVVRLLVWLSEHATLLYRPWLWLIVAAVAVAVARQRALSIVLASTLFNEFVVCLTTPAADLRYSYPVMVTMIIAVVASVQSRSSGIDEPDANLDPDRPA